VGLGFESLAEHKKGSGSIRSLFVFESSPMPHRGCHEVTGIDYY